MIHPRRSRRAVALIAAYALALQPLLASLVWLAQAASAGPSQWVICSHIAPDGGGSNAPADHDRHCPCCRAGACSVGGLHADLPRPIFAPWPTAAPAAVLAIAFAAVPPGRPGERYRQRAPPAA
jgi:Protein of unknown function (DUF2946)